MLQLRWSVVLLLTLSACAFDSWLASDPRVLREPTPYRRMVIRSLIKQGIITPTTHYRWEPCRSRPGMCVTLSDRQPTSVSSPSAPATNAPLAPQNPRPLASKPVAPPANVASAKPEAPLPTDKLLDRAKQQASREPILADFIGVKQEFTFEDGQLYQVYTRPLSVTLIHLEPGETLLDAVAGDTERWALHVVHDQDGTPPRTHLVVKPLHLDLRTELMLLTSKRQYYLHLTSHRHTPMLAVSWRYPVDTERTAAQQQAEEVQAAAALLCRHHPEWNAAYTISVKRGSPAWIPTQVCDNGQRTHINFPPHMHTREAPILLVLTSRGTPSQAIWRHRHHTYIVDQLFDRAELRLGVGRQAEVVRIERQRQGWSPFGMTEESAYHAEP